jgi:hypothetical protein
MMITVLGRVWDKTHILSDNHLLSVFGLSESQIGQSGYFLLEKVGFNWKIVNNVIKKP